MLIPQGRYRVQFCVLFCVLAMFGLIGGVTANDKHDGDLFGQDFSAIIKSHPVDEIRN